MDGGLFGGVPLCEACPCGDCCEQQGARVIDVLGHYNSCVRAAVFLQRWRSAAKLFVTCY